jgi:hypothetical protein
MSRFAGHASPLFACQVRTQRGASGLGRGGGLASARNKKHSLDLEKPRGWFGVYVPGSARYSTVLGISSGGTGAAFDLEVCGAGARLQWTGSAPEDCK